LGLTGDNATSNDTQANELGQAKNSFDEVNRVRCFNHTIQLSAKAMLRCFSRTPEEDIEKEDPDMPDLEGASVCDDDDEDLLLDGAEDSGDDDDDDDDDDKSVPEDEEDEEDAMRETLQEATAAVKFALRKVRCT
jgi:hypothetical protein